MIFEKVAKELAQQFELDVDSIRRLYGVSRDNIYQIRKRIKGNFATLLSNVAQEMEQMPAIAAR